MLAHVGRKLRLAGYDTLIDQGQIPDRALLERANAEGRYLLTCDHQLQQHKESHNVIYFASNDEAVWAKLLIQTLQVDWTFAPLTRCLQCNTKLRLANESERARLPENIRKEHQPGYYCETCDKLYWNGSHVSRMRAQLEAFNELA